LPYFGFMQFDTADLLLMENRSTFILDTVILHEMGHVLGMTGNFWRSQGLITGSFTPDPRFIGPQATAAYNRIFGVNEPGVPLESFFTAGGGTAESHWRELLFVGQDPRTALVNELMTGFVGPRTASPAYSPISEITIGSLADIGYAVDMGRRDIYFPLSGVQFSSALAPASSSTSSLSGSGTSSPTLAAPLSDGLLPAPSVTPPAPVVAARVVDLAFEDEETSDHDDSTSEPETGLFALPEGILEAALAD
jgi:hypothetical protein